jgi:hypothetical protein
MGLADRPVASLARRGLGRGHSRRHFGARGHGLSARTVADLVVEATVLGLDRMELELEVAPAEHQESLRAQRALRAQVAEWTTSDGPAGAA